MTEYIYLNSRYSQFNQDTKYHRFNITKPIIGNLNDISLRLAEAEIPISYYNIITGYNDTFSFKHIYMFNDSPFAHTYSFTFPQKNYTSKQLLTYINAQITIAGAVINGVTTSLSFDEQSLKFTITCVADTAIIQKIEITDTLATRIMGFTTGDATPDTTNVNTLSLTSNDATNLNRTKNIYLFTDVFDTENCNNNNEGQTILSKIQASQKFGDIVSYQNSSDLFFKIPQQNTYIDHINIKLLDDDDEFLDFNKLNFCLSLAVQLTPKKKIDYDDENRTPIDTLINMVQQEICEE